MRSPRIDVKDAVGLEEEIARAGREVEGMEDLAADDAEPRGDSALLEDPGIHDERDASSLCAKVLLEFAELAEGFAIRSFPKQVDLGRPGLVGEEDGSAALDARLGGEE